MAIASSSNGNHTRTVGAQSPTDAAIALVDDCDLGVDEIVAEVKHAFSPLERELVGFEPLLIQAIYALLTRENLLIFSPAGTAKTLFARLLFQRIGGARIFDTQMSKGTLAEEMFGSVDIEQMKSGRVLHNTRDTLVDADLAFVDEFFDANDMVLRALLGIFHERVFKKGSQVERARLHTGIAAANYVRSTEVTQAVVDRFLFRATIIPDYSPFTLTSIDRAFDRHYGGSSEPSDQPCVPLSHIRFLAALVGGRIPDRQITAPPHVLFMKNALINRYRALRGERVAGGNGAAPPPYVSPRTYAKSRLVLNAAALLRGRMEVNCDDLSQLRYVITTVGGPEEEERCFDEALQATMVKIREPERENIDRLVSAQELAEQVHHRVCTGEKIPCTRFVQRLLRLFGLVSEGEVSFDHVRRFVEDVRPQVEEVTQLKQGLLRRLEELTRRIDYRDSQLLR